MRVHNQHTVKTVLYLGGEPLRLQRAYTSPSMDFRFEIVNLRECAAEPLLVSQDWADNALAPLAKGEPEKALGVVMSRLRDMKREDQDWAAGTLVQLSGILEIEVTVKDRLKEVGMINLMENKPKPSPKAKSAPYPPNRSPTSRTACTALPSTIFPGTTAELTFENGYPPMAPTAGNKRLLQPLNESSRSAGLPEAGELDPMLGGAGDISFIAPFVDSLFGESVDVESFPRQAKRAALLIR